MNRFIRPAIALLVFAAVTVLSWYAVHQFRKADGPAACSMEPGATPPQTNSPDSVATTKPRKVSIEEAVSASVLASTASQSPLALGAVSAPPSVDGGLPPVVKLLDGGTGVLPAAAMHCTFDGGFSCGQCTHDAECPQGHGCIANRQTRRFECLPSECEDDQGCFPGTVCRALAGAAPGPLVRRCVPTGSRVLGERCLPGAADAVDACTEDLVCFDGACRARCGSGSSPCPEGQQCHDTLRDARVCVPDCRHRGCSGEERCVEVFPGSFQCASVSIDECGDGRACPQGQYCLTRARDGRAGRFCAAPCKSWLGSDACPQGYVCGRGGPEQSSCYRACSPQDMSSCPQGWMCTTVSEDKQSWGCRPDVSG